MQGISLCNDSAAARAFLGRSASSSTSSSMNLLKVLVGNCYCVLPHYNSTDYNAKVQFVELHGIRFIGLGCMSDELTAQERVYDTLEQLTDRSERLMSIGYLTAAPTTTTHSFPPNTTYETNEEQERPTKVTQTIPLDVWYRTTEEAGKYYFTAKTKNNEMSRPVQMLVEQVLKKDYKGAKLQLSLQLSHQKKNLRAGVNRDNDAPYLAGITAHNLAVVKMLSGEDEEDVLTLFQEAISLKENAFGLGHVEVALSWDELGIQYFAHSDFTRALDAFEKSQQIRRNHRRFNSNHDTSGMAMVLNNIACCQFQEKQFAAALETLKEARALLSQRAFTKDYCDLDLLCHAIVLGNCGYLHLCLKLYDEARSLFEEALLIQQSVLSDESHRAICDTRSNLEFTNAFHM